jgi:hypothetical protein
LFEIAYQTWLLFSAASFGHTFEGSIIGEVTDATALLPQANVTLTNLGTSERRTMPTDNAGFYQFVNLAPGDKRARASPGFKAGRPLRI